MLSTPAVDSPDNPSAASCFMRGICTISNLYRDSRTLHQTYMPAASARLRLHRNVSWSIPKINRHYSKEGRKNKTAHTTASLLQCVVCRFHFCLWAFETSGWWVSLHHRPFLKLYATYLSDTGLFIQSKMSFTFRQSEYLQRLALTRSRIQRNVWWSVSTINRHSSK